MKKTILISGLAIFLAVFTISCKSSNSSKDAKTNNNQTEIVNDTIVKTFKVDGECGMCKDRIETAAKSIDGVDDAVWSIDTKILTLTYSNKLDPAIVLKKIADVGHDNEMFKASDDVYNKLPKCCLYRK